MKCTLNLSQQWKCTVVYCLTPWTSRHLSRWWILVLLQNKSHEVNKYIEKHYATIYGIAQAEPDWILLLVFRVVHPEEKDLWLLLERKAENQPQCQLDLFTLLEKVWPLCKIHSFKCLPVIFKIHHCDKLSHLLSPQTGPMQLPTVSIA